ncbi:MAG: enzyme repeat domain protein, partial [Phenylobacterium sp.]|nr:enzyme repeat domain protein [Phenylobacterium sp.]
MTSRRRNLLLAALLTAAVGAAGCSTVSKLNPFKGSGGPKEVATEGQRISIIPQDEVLAPAEALKGVDFALPPITTQADWPLPGGTPEQSVENVDAGVNLAIAWRRNVGQGSSNAIHVTGTPVVAAGRIYTLDAEAGVS